MDIETQNNKVFSGPIAIWCITPNGKGIALKIKAGFKDSTLFFSSGIIKKTRSGKNTFIFKKLSKEIHYRFNKFQGHVFIFSTGIAVRIIAPLLKSKTIDPAVVVVDDNGNHAISLISGHLGGANLLTKEIAGAINAAPVITTATDTNFLPAIDIIAKKRKLFIETPENIKHVNMAFLMGVPVDLYDPSGFLKNHLPDTFLTSAADIGTAKGKIYCSYEIKNVSRGTLILRPPVLNIGIGCNRNTGLKEIKLFLLKVLKKGGLSPASIRRFATTEVKKDEPGLLALSREMKIKMDFYGKKELNSVKTIMTPSKMVEKHLGVKSVCEAAAILSAGNGRLIVPKKKNKDVTIAVAIKK
ncbi:MAG: cobalamin biosynthesis protein CbiG [Deltaproteobacteria bacterium]|nr:cobalamin biosynthesis protein CbiG [Deltaproteobacteria bacterium]